MYKHFVLQYVGPNTCDSADECNQDETRIDEKNNVLVNIVLQVVVCRLFVLEMYLEPSQMLHL